MSFTRFSFTGVAAAVLLLPIGDAHADPKAACVSASEQGQQLRDQGKLREAREQLLYCARNDCPTIVARDCRTWLADVDAAMPTIVLSAVDENQVDLIRVRVSVDGSPLLEGLDGKAVPMNPGPHAVRFETEGRAPVELPVLVREGDRRRTVVAHFKKVGGDSSTAPAPAAHSSTSAMTVSAYAAGSLGLVAIGVFAVLGITGKNELSNLHDTCGRTASCSQSDVDATRSKLIAADVSLYAGLGALALSTGLFLGRPRTPSGTAAASSAFLSPVRFGLAPLPGGGFATISSSF